MELPWNFHFSFSFGFRHLWLEAKEELQTSNFIRINGMEYRLKMALVVGFHSSDPIFGEIKVITVNCGDPRFVVERWFSSLVPPANAYELTASDGFTVISLEDVLDYYPLSIYKISGKKMIILKHLVFDCAEYSC